MRMLTEAEFVFSRFAPELTSVRRKGVWLRRQNKDHTDMGTPKYLQLPRWGRREREHWERVWERCSLQQVLAN